MKYLIATLTIAFASVLAAQDYGDAPASYGLASALSGGSEHYLGTYGTATNDPLNPVTPAWIGDSDDGIVGTPVWNPWSSFNQLTVHVEGEGFLYMFVDADDSGTFEQSELYTYGHGRLLRGPLDLTFKDIKLMNAGGYSLNGANKVGVRIMYMANLYGMPPQLTPTDTAIFGEVEDWLIDVAPAVLTISEEILEDAEIGGSYGVSIRPISGTGPYTWAQTGGALAAGFSIVQVGDNFELTGSPAASSAGVYSFDIHVTDGTSAVATRSLTLRVLPAPYALPFTDSFSTDKHWTMGNDWSIGSATGFAGSGSSSLGYPAVEPATDFTPTNGDDKVLMSTLGAIELDRPWEDYATSAKIDCTGISSVQLEFRRWYSFAGIVNWTPNAGFTAIEITSDGQTWDEIWIPPANPQAVGVFEVVNVAEVAWSKIQVDISQWAANKPWIRIRWRTGVKISAYGSMGSTVGSTMNSTGHCGWAIDDVVVRETPMSGSLVAHSFEIASPNSFQNPFNSQWYPIVYPGTLHSWSVMVDNPTTEAITISEAEVLIRQGIPPGTPSGPSGYWDRAPYLQHIDVCYDFGVWTLDQPVTIPASATNVSISGKFDFQGAPANFALVLFQAHVDLIGTHGSANTSVEIKAIDDFVPNLSSMPGMYLYEVQAGTTPVDNGQAATNLRDFGSIAVNWSSNWLNIVIDHTSSGTLNLGTPTITGADANQFAINTSSYSNQLVGNSASTYFSLVFTPTSPGPKTATVTFTHDASNTGTPFTFEIIGFGVGNGPALKVFEDTTTGPQIGNGSPASGGRDFGQVDHTAGSGQLTIAIENQGNQDLTLGTPTITGTGASEFSLNTTGILATVAASGSTSFVIDFDPSAIGIFSAAIEFTHNDTGTATPFIINITGEGIILAPIIEVRGGVSFGPTVVPGGSFDLGSVTVGASAVPSYAVFVHNLGWAGLNLSTPVINGPNAASFSLDLGRFYPLVRPSEYTIIVVRFDPLAKGMKTATLEFTHNDTSAISSFTLDFTGIGDDPNGVQVASSTMLEAREGNFYSAQLQASGGTGPYTWAEFSDTLNAGLTIAADGTISGTPVNGLGTYNTFVVEVTDALGGTELGIVKIMIQPPVGFLGKDPNGGSGGCVASPSENIWLWGLLGLTMLAIIRRRAGCR